MALLVFYGVTKFYPQPQFSNFTLSILLTVIAAFLENLTEPFYVIMLLKMQFTHRAKAESISIFIKSVAIYVLIVNNFGLLSYAIA